MAPIKVPDDPINPSYYKNLGEYSALHVIHRWGLGFVLGNVVRYIQRAGTKPGHSKLQELKKARWYLQREIHLLDPENEADPATERNGYTVK